MVIAVDIINKDRIPFRVSSQSYDYIDKKFIHVTSVARIGKQKNNSTYSYFSWRCHVAAIA